MTVDPRKAARIGVAALVLLAGVLGLWRGYQQPGDPSGSGMSTTAPAPAMTVTGATVLASDGPETQVRLSVRNGTGADDVLLGISSGAGASTTLGGEPDGVPIKAGQTLAFGAGERAITITGMYGPVVAGQVVALSLEFQRAGAVLVQAPVVAQ